MNKLFFVFCIGVTTLSFSQIHNRMFKFNVGIGKEQFALQNTFQYYNDTSLNHFSYIASSPIFTISEEFTFNELFSLGGSLGYQYYNINYNNKKVGTNLFFLTLNPQLSIFYRKGFEYYIKLQAGFVYRDSDFEVITEQMQRHLPQQTNLITGVTLAGLNFFVSNRWALNAELSIWTPQWANIGVSYRFFKGEMPDPEKLDYYTD